MVLVRSWFVYFITVPLFFYGVVNVLIAYEDWRLPDAPVVDAEVLRKRLSLPARCAEQVEAA